MIHTPKPRARRLVKRQIQKTDHHWALYDMMMRIRLVEEAIEKEYARQEMKCPVHLSIGQEASAAGVCLALEKTDQALSTHRGHAHYLAKGGHVNRMIAELYGRVTGCARGKGGSMHLVDTSVGFYGCSAIVAGTISIAAGLALSNHMQGTSHVAVAFFGDGAADEGVLYETLNFAALKKLPIIFVCENNRYATHSHQRARQPLDNLKARAEAFGVQACKIDGTDVFQVYETAQQAIHRARTGYGPSFIECQLYRWRKHVGPGTDTDMGYRSQEELDHWLARCPIKQAETHLQKKGYSQQAFDKLGQTIHQDIQNAFEFAKQSPFPDPSELTQHVVAQDALSIYGHILPVLAQPDAPHEHRADLSTFMPKTGF